MSSCPACGRGIDPLRAGEVAFVEGRFVYFCDRAHKAEWLTTRTPATVETAEPPPVAEVVAQDSTLAEDAPHQDAPPVSVESAPAPASPSPTTNELRLPILLGYVGALAGAMATGVALLGPSADGARLPLAGIACASALGVMASSREGLGHRTSRLSAVALIVAFGCAVWSWRESLPAAPSMASFAGIMAASLVAVWMAMLLAAERVVAGRGAVAVALDAGVDVEVRPGEQVTVAAGEVVPVDGVVSGGEAVVSPWAFARTDVTKREGAPVVAGAVVVSGSLRVMATWTGRDRAFVKLMSGSPDPLSRSALASLATLLDGRLLLPFGALAGVVAFANGMSLLEATACGAACVMAFGAPIASFAVWLIHARAHLRGLDDGIVYRDAASFDRASRASIAVICARGTVLLGEPEIVTVEAVGANEAESVLALAAAVANGSPHPFASAILRAARARAIQPEAIRSALHTTGSGATALDARGERVVLGRRVFLLSEKVSVAAADDLVREHEAQGRSVLLVARDAKLVGVIALQDGIRAGARAAVQKLHDGRIEPILLSGEARETCEAIGRALDIEHLRPEVAGPERGAEVKGLGEGGEVIAVLGHPSVDDAALGAADVSVALDAAGASPGEWSVALASDDVRASAEALTLAHAARERSTRVMVAAFAPGIVASFLLAFQLMPLWAGPLSGPLTAVIALLYVKD